jgi:hypothetical protein
VALEGAAGHQLRQRLLLDDAAADILQALGVDHVCAQARRTHHVAHPQPREQHLREAADVDDPVADVQRAQRRNCRGVVAELAVIVIFEQPAMPGDGIVEQGQAPLEGHHRAGRELVRRRDVDQPHAFTGQVLDAEALRVRADRHEPRAMGPQGVYRQLVARLLHHHRIALVQEQARQQRDRLLRAVDDDDVFRRADHPATPREVVSDRLAQRQQPGAARIAPVAAGRGAGQFPPPGARQHRIGKRLAVLQVVQHRRGAAAQRQFGQAAQAGGIARLRRHVRAGRHVRARRHRPANEGAGARGGDRQLFRAKQLISREHGVPGQAQLQCQRAGGR